MAISTRLHQLTDQGQSVWIDFLSRELLHGGELARLMREDGVSGVTSNPTIFQKAITAGDAYAEQLRRPDRDGERPEVHPPRRSSGGPSPGSKRAANV